MTKAVDEIDREIIAALDRDGRATLADIGRQVGLSAPATKERLRRLQDDGVITSFDVRVDTRRLGYTLEAIVRLKPRAHHLPIVERMIVEEPRFIACDRVTGDDCFVARLALVDVSELDEILLPLHEHAETNTSIVKSSLLTGRLPELDPSIRPDC